MTAMHFSANFKSKMADGTDGNERGLYHFVESLRTLLIGIQNLNTQDVSVNYCEQAELRLEDAIVTFQLLLNAQCMAKRGLCPSRFQDNNRSCFDLAGLLLVLFLLARIEPTVGKRVARRA